jgi:hypothetical protein
MHGDVFFVLIIPFEAHEVLVNNFFILVRGFY